MSIVGLPYDYEKAITRFWSYVDQKDNYKCWPWKGCVSRKYCGYGEFKLKGLKIRAHRLAYVLRYKVRLKDGECVLHHCDNSLCCNPNHLFIGTQKDNIKDRHNKGRSRGPMSSTKVGGIHELG